MLDALPETEYVIVETTLLSLTAPSIRQGSSIRPMMNASTHSMPGATVYASSRGAE